MKQKFDVQGMTCAACSANVEKSVRKVAGVDSVQVNLLAKSMVVEFDAPASIDVIEQAVASAGYSASVEGQTPEKKAEPQSEIKAMRNRFLISLVFMVPLFYICMGHMWGFPLPSFFTGHENMMTFAFTQFLLTLPVLIVNKKYFVNGFKSLFNRTPNMDSLIAVGSSAAVVYGIIAIYKIGYGMGHGDMEMAHSYAMDLYFETSAMILTLINLGKFLEERSKGKTSEAISKLMDLAPKTAIVEINGELKETATKDLKVGDVILIKPGASIPVDGVVIEGSSYVDESAVTGESIPVEKTTGSNVTGATVNGAGSFKMRAEKVGEDTALAGIIRLVEEASASKAPISKLADKVSGIFVPAVITFAVAATIIWALTGKSADFAISIGIAILVVSCPCALGLATPTAIMVGTGKGAENGILIRSAEALETAHKIDTIVLDKTGTVTQGRPSVTDIITDRSDLLEIAAAMELSSEHPLAEAVVREARKRGVKIPDSSGFVSTTGRGVSAVVKGQRYYGGNAEFMQGRDMADYAEKASALQNDAKTVLYFSDEKHVIGIIAASDEIKPTSAKAIAEFKSMGIDVVLLTGDNENSARAVASKVGIPKVIAKVLPEDKERHIRALQQQGRKVGMVGDGINDAPALVRADVGIAIGAGTDVAIESADIVLQRSDLMDAAAAVQLSRATLRNIKQNLFWALIYNSILIPVAAGVLYPALGIKLNPMIGAAAMSLSSVCVVSNALRLKLFKPKWHTETEASVTEVSVETSEEEQAACVLNVEGMMCAHCEGRVVKALSEIGVDAKADHTSGKVRVLSGEASEEDMRSAIEKAGYTVK